MSTATCPMCGEQYLAAATVCASCRVALVPDPLDGPGNSDHPPPSGQPAPVELAWPEGEDEVGYDLDDWSAEDCDALTASLRSERVPFEWRDREVVVPEGAADLVEELIDLIDHPDALDPDDDGDDDGGAALLSELYVASDVLSGDPAASGAVIEMLELAPQVDDRPAPYGVEAARWQAIGGRAVALAALLEADADPDEVRPAAAALRALLRDLV